MLFALGAAFGSFLNVLALRYQPGQAVFDLKKISGRSRCPHCRKKLRWYELLPIVSFLFLRGRCSACRKKISFQYPLIEIASGAIFAAVPWHFKNFFPVGAILPIRSDLTGFYIFAVLWILIFWTLLLVSVIDARHYLIPDELNWILGFLGAGVLAVKLTLMDWAPDIFRYFTRGYALVLSPFGGGFLVNHAAGAVAAAGAFFVLFYLSRGRAMGFGDVKLALVLGFALGLPDTVIMIFFSFFFGGIFGAAAVCLGRKKLKSMMPFGPFIALGALAAVFFGHQALSWYFSFFRG